MMMTDAEKKILDDMGNEIKRLVAENEMEQAEAKLREMYFVAEKMQHKYEQARAAEVTYG
jgi:hypothetical protein